MARQKNNDNGGADFFSHDYDMRNDIKVKALRRKFSHAGYAVWCFVLEVLTDSDNFEIEYGEVEQELLAADFDVPVEELRDIISYSCKIGLLQQEDGKLYSNAHKRRFIQMMEARNRRKEQRERRAEINRANGRMGGNPNFKKGQPNPYYNITEDNPEITETSEKITEDNPNVTYSNVTQSNATKEKAKVTKNSTAQRFTPPTIEEVAIYAKEKNYAVDAERFVDYYTSNGWRVGRNPMKDWRAAVRTWAQREKQAALPAQHSEQQGMTLGVGERITANGTRTYGTSGVHVPPQAPPRPSAAHWWSEATGSWEKTI